MKFVFPRKQVYWALAFTLSFILGLLGNSLWHWLSLTRIHTQLQQTVQEFITASPSLETEGRKVLINELIRALDSSNAGSHALTLKTPRHYLEFGFWLFFLLGAVTFWREAIKAYHRNQMRSEITKRKLEEERSRNLHSAKLSSLGEMAAGIGHEIQNPISVLDGYTQKLRSYLNSPEKNPELIAEAVHKIQTTLNRLSRIARTMQSFARNAENDPMESVTVKNVLDQTLVLCSERFRNHDIRLELDFPMEESYLHCRPTEIQQILINLVSNSFHAVENASERWVRLGVSVSAEKTEFSVTDSGAGIPPAIRAKIMQPFFTTKQAGKGTGLGLSISRAIAVQHKGDLFLDTQCKNTRFVLSLPTHFPAPEMKAA